MKKISIRRSIYFNKQIPVTRSILWLPVFRLKFINFISVQTVLSRLKAKCGVLWWELAKFWFSSKFVVKNVYFMLRSIIGISCVCVFVVVVGYDRYWLRLETQCDLLLYQRRFNFGSFILLAMLTSKNLDHRQDNERYIDSFVELWPSPKLYLR